MRMALHHSYLYCPKHQVLGNTAGLWFQNFLSATTKNSFQSHTLTTWICMLNLAMSTTCCSRPCGSLAWQWSIEAGELLARCSSLSTVLGVWGPQCIRKSAPGNSIEALLSICQFNWASWVDVQNWQENYWNILKWWFLHLVIYVYVFVHSVSLWYMSVGSALASVSQCDQHGGQNVAESYHGWHCSHGKVVEFQSADRLLSQTEAVVEQLAGIKSWGHLGMDQNLEFAVFRHIYIFF